MNYTTTGLSPTFWNIHSLVTVAIMSALVLKMSVPPVFRKHHHWFGSLKIAPLFLTHLKSYRISTRSTLAQKKDVKKLNNLDKINLFKLNN